MVGRVTMRFKRRWLCDSGLVVMDGGSVIPLTMVCDCSRVRGGVGRKKVSGRNRPEGSAGVC